MCIEELDGEGKCLVHLAPNTRYCPNCGITEVASPAPSKHLGPFAKREFPPRGERVWHEAPQGEGSEVMFEAGPLRTYWVRTPFVRWDREEESIRPLGDIGDTHKIEVRGIDRSSGSVILPGVEDGLATK